MTRGVADRPAMLRQIGAIAAAATTDAGLPRSGELGQVGLKLE
jgi:hypothetical protein